MSAGWHIRAGTPDDAVEIARLTSASIRRWIAPDCTPAGTVHLLESMAASAVAARMAEGCCYFVAEGPDADADAGPCLTLGVAAIRPPAHLYNLFIVDAWQGRGLGRALWLHAREAFFAGRGAPCPITVNAARNALAAYRCLGFADQGPEQVQHGVPSTPMLWRP